MKVYVGGYASGGTLTAQLSDGSAPNYVHSAFSGTGQYDAVYTLTYKAASAGKLLTVKWVQSSGSGNVTLQAATLVQTTTILTRNDNGLRNEGEIARNVSLQNESLKIFPNPFNENITLNYSGKETGRGSIKIYTAEMRLVGNYPFEKASWNMTNSIPVARLANGLYFIEFNLGDLKIIRRQLKMQ